MELQLQITTDLKSLPAAIEFNYPELKSALESYLERFKGLLVTEDGIRQAKEDRAEINKIAATISRARIDTKKLYLAPFEGFEAKAQELEGIAKRTAESIDAQLKDYEARRKKEKSKGLADAFGRRIGEAFGADMETPERKTAHWREYFAAMTDPKRPGNWLNASVSEQKAAVQMNAEIQRCKEALAKMGEIYAGEDTETRITARFALCRRFDLADAAMAVKTFKEQREAALKAREDEERRKREEAERREAEETAKQEAMERAKAKLAEKREAEAKSPATNEHSAAATAHLPETQTFEVTHTASEKCYSFTIRVTGKASNLAKVKEAIFANNCTYERLAWEEI